jgi:acetate kinase
LAPLHNPANLSVIQETQKIFNDIPHIAVFDTAFHQTISEVNYLYAIPQKYYEKYKIRKYGFHGISHEYVSRRVEKFEGKKYSRIISCHIGNGASISAIKDGKCVNTSMGFTPVDGLVMGTRAGDIDPGVVLFLQEKEKLSA